jgi:VanZ family protein
MANLVKRVVDRIGRVVHRYPLSLVIILVIVYLSLFKVANDNLPKIENLDKVAHFCMYAGLCSILWFEYFKTHKQTSLIKMIMGAVVAPLLFSGAMEVAQVALTDNRSADWYDFLFNTLGVVAAIFIGLYVIRPVILKKRRQ